MSQKDVGNKIPIYKLKKTDEVMKYYDDWGQENKYDKDMLDWNYTGPKETTEIFIKWDEGSDDDWLILIYIKDNSPDGIIVIEDKSDPDKKLSYEYKSNEIFKASDLMVDSLTQLLSRLRSKKN